MCIRDSFPVVPQEGIQGGYSHGFGKSRGDDERYFLLSFSEQGGGIEGRCHEVLPDVELPEGGGDWACTFLEGVY